MSDGGSPITFYDMSLKRTDSTAVSSSGDVKSSATFEYLEPDTEFEFGVVARNDIGSSNRSFVTFKTQSAGKHRVRIFKKVGVKFHSLFFLIKVLEKNLGYFDECAMEIF